MKYFLMNKDTELLSFTAERNEFDEVICREETWLCDLRPWGYYNLTDYLSGRQAPKHRKHIEELLERYGCNDLEGFLNVTYALSLNDTFWVKPAESGLRWADVSLYSNEFDELVSNAAFDGHFGSTSLSSTSPEFGTDGYFAKCWMREDKRIMLYKSGSSTFEIEPLSEFLACQAEALLHLDFVNYDLSFHHGRLISKCELFTDEETGLIKAYDVLPKGERTISSMLDYFSKIGAEDQFRRMCVLDALILNTDRHLGNFGVLADNRTMKIKGIAPVFDNNRSLLYDMDSDQLSENLTWCIGTCKPRIGVDFIATARGMLTDDIRSDLKVMEDFSFTPHPTIHADPERLEALSAVVRHQAKTLLGK